MTPKDHRGVQKLGAKTMTSVLHGLVRDDPHTRQEFPALAGAASSPAGH
jgi:GTP cyclohydrolase I